jgi:hypothetical protein
MRIEPRAIPGGHSSVRTLRFGREADALRLMSHRASDMRIEPFTIDDSDDMLHDLTARIRNTRWPESAPGLPWEQGTDAEYLHALLDYWAHGFDWRAASEEPMLVASDIGTFFAVA